jgi:hypothetical protein
MQVSVVQFRPWAPPTSFTLEKSNRWKVKVIHVGEPASNVDHFCSIFVLAIRAIALSASTLRRTAFV